LELQPWLEHAKLPDNLPETKTCKFCNAPMTLVRINCFGAVWIHHGVDIETCAAQNPLTPGFPMIAVYMNWPATVTRQYKLSGKDKNGTKS
jgi:hypothetical protein